MLPVKLSQPQLNAMGFPGRIQPDCFTMNAQSMPGIPPILPTEKVKPKKTKWACVEERIQNGLEYGSVIRKVEFWNSE